MHFLEHGSDMDADCVAFIDTGIVSDALRDLRDPYLTSPWDEIHGEGVHRDASRVLSHGPSTQTAMMCSTVAVKQILHQYDQMSQLERGLVHRDYDAPLKLALHRRRCMRDPFGVRVTSATFWDWLYRIGTWARETIPIIKKALLLSR